MVAGYFIEGAQEKKVMSLFGQYLPPELVRNMADNPLSFGLAGMDAELTVLFSDIRNFSGISEQLTAPQLTSYINEYFNCMSQIIVDEKGTLDKYIGDCIMSFWGAPAPNPQHAFYAVRAALKMCDASKVLAASFAARGLPSLNIGIGLNSGMLRVGDMGSSLRRSYTVMGDAVNLASRIEGITKQYGLSLLVGQNVVALAPEFIYREVDRVRVLGKNEIVTIFEPIGLATDAHHNVEELRDWSLMLDRYYQGDWGRVIFDIKALVKNYGEQLLYEVFLKRAMHYQVSPPTGPWDGVTNYDTK
jgi:adenylate cyclase